MAHKSLTMPDWGFSAPLVVSDPGKLSYFARANAVRAGVRGTWGTLSGLGEVVGGRPAPTDIVPQASTSPYAGTTFDPNAAYGDATPNIPQASVNTMNGNGTATIGDWFSRLGASLFGPSVSAPPLVQASAVDYTPLLLGGAAAIGIGYLVFKKKR